MQYYYVTIEYNGHVDIIGVFTKKSFREWLKKHNADRDENEQEHENEFTFEEIDVYL